jgi:hypothetical protein
MAVDGRTVGEWETGAGFFVREIDLPADALVGQGALARLTIQSAGLDGSRVDTAIEQFDLQAAGRLMWAYDEGWSEAEYNPLVGVWRWASDRSTLRIVDASTTLAVTLRVESPRRYFDADPRVRLLAGERVLGETSFSNGDWWSVIVPFEALQASGGRLTITTDKTFVPAASGGSRDERKLGLRVFDLSVTAQP